MDLFSRCHPVDLGKHTLADRPYLFAADYPLWRPVCFYHPRGHYPGFALPFGGPWYPFRKPYGRLGPTMDTSRSILSNPQLWQDPLENINFDIVGDMANHESFVSRDLGESSKCLDGIATQQA